MGRLSTSLFASGEKTVCIVFDGKLIVHTVTQKPLKVRERNLTPVLFPAVEMPSKYFN